MEADVKKLGLVAVFALGAIMVVTDLNPVSPGVGVGSVVPTITYPLGDAVVGPTVRVTGTAPAEWDVTVYNSTLEPLGETTADENGHWAMNLTFEAGPQTISAGAQYGDSPFSDYSPGVNFTVDAVAPDTSITGGPSGTVSALTASFTFSSDDNLATFECLLDADPAEAANWNACESPKNYTDLERGEHVFMVRAVDAVGNRDATPAERTWKIGRPVVSVARPADGTYYAGTELIIEVTWAEPVWVFCTRTNTEALPCDLSPKIPLTIGGVTRYAVADRTEDSRTVTFRYFIQREDTDTDGIVVGPAILFNEYDSIQDASFGGNDVAPGLPDVVTTGVRVNGSVFPSVTTTSDSGPGSLRAAINAANNVAGQDTIVFAESLTCEAAPCDTIALGSQLPVITGDLIIIGPGAANLTIGGGSADRIMEIRTPSIVELSGVTLASAGGTYTDGGAIANSGVLEVTDSVIRNNTGRDGGAIVNGGTLTVRNTLFEANRAERGAGIFNAGTVVVTNSTFSANLANIADPYAGGGGIYNDRRYDGYPAPTATVTNSTFSANVAANGQSGGGGIYNASELVVTDSTFSANSAVHANGGGIQNEGTLEVTNSTFSANVVTTNNQVGNGFGGGLYSAFTATVTNATFSANVARSSGGGGIFGGELDLTNTILYGNTGDDCRSTLTTNESNLFATGTCGTAAVTTDPLLVALADNGGPTQTMAIPENSVANNAGTDTGCPTTDQRGGVRAKTVENRCDIGAFEFGAGFLNLASLSLSAGTLTPGFAVGTTTYTASVDNATTSTAVTATLADPTNNATLTWRLRDQTGTNAYTAFSSPQTVNLAVGDNVIDLEVTMASCCTRTYTVTVTRAGGGGGGDTTKPEVATFELQTPSDTGVADDDGVTNAAVLVYDLVFTESVTGLTSGDFTVTGTSTKCVVGAAGSAATYTVTLSNCTGGTVTLTLNADSVTDGTNDGPTNNAVAGSVTIDRTAPAVTAFAGNGSAGYTLTFQEPVTGLTAGDFTRSGRSLGSCAVSNVTGTDGSPLDVAGTLFHRSWTVAVTNCPTSLTLTLDKQTVHDVADNAGPPRAVRARTTKT
jgi:hypothetical protein